MRGNKGFTLVEMAIVLVIIGIILGAVIKGQDLIAGAKEKKFKAEVDQLATSYYTYYDKYSRIPGDDNKADRWTGATKGNNDGLINSNGSPAVDETDPAKGALDHLRRAGLLLDQPGGGADNTAFVSSTPGVTINFGSGTAANWGSATNLIIVTNLPAEDMLAFDTKYDNGVSNTGKVRGVLAAGTLETTYTTGTSLLAYSVK